MARPPCGYGSRPAALIRPHVSGGGGPPCAARWWRGRGPRRISFDESETSSQRPPPPRGACHRAGHYGSDPLAWSPSPLSRGRKAHAPVLAARLCARALLHAKKRASQANKGEAERRKARTERPLRAIAASPLGGFAAPPSSAGRGRLAFRRSTAVLAKFSRLGSVRSRASWSRTTDPRPGQPAPGGPANPCQIRRGGPGEFPNRPRRSYEPHPGHRSRSINRPSPVDVPWPSEMGFF